MRTQQPFQSLAQRVTAFLVSSFLWFFAFFFSTEFLIGAVAGLTVPIFTVNDVLNDWVDNGGLVEACSQLEAQK
jgi:hypothetical protein